MKELDNKNDFFESIGKEIPFDVPKDYFDKLPTRIQELCVGSSSVNTSQKVSIWQVVKTQFTLAFGFVGFALIAFAIFFYIKPQDQAKVLTNDDYIKVVEKHIYDYDEVRLTNESEGLVNYDSIRDEMKDEMIQYLLDENVDYVTLIEQY